MRGRKIECAVAAAVALVVVAAPSAYAGYKDGNAQGRRFGNEIGAHAKTRVSVKQETGPKNGSPVTPVDTDWTPPPCWYEPFATPKQFKRDVDTMKREKRIGWPSLGMNTGEHGMREQYERKHNVLDGPAYKNFNLNKQGKGMWWHAVLNSKRKDEIDFMNPPDCFDKIFWAKKEEANKENGVSPKVLAGYAYDSVKVPDTKVEMRPQRKSTVNLPTWMWLSKKKFKPVKVRATLPGTGLWAETTAKPVGLSLDPGTDEADTHPANGECRINDDGSIGRSYKKGDADKAPPCGVTYRHASNEGPYKLKASVRWEMSWRGSDDDGTHKLPDGTFESTQDVNVQEVQTVN